MVDSPSYPVPALEKGLDILETLAAAETPQSLAELATTLERRSGELFRMLNCLERRRFLVRDPVSGKYELSLRMVALAHAHSINQRLVRFARRPMQDFREAVRQSCHLSVLDGESLLVVAAAESPERVRISVEVGGRFDPAATASGRLLLAWQEPEDREWILARSPRAQTFDATAAAAFAAELATIRKTGVSRAVGETVEGVRDCAILLGSPESGIFAAFTVTTLPWRTGGPDEAALLTAMRATVAAMHERIGLTGTPL